MVLAEKNTHPHICVFGSHTTHSPRCVRSSASITASVGFPVGPRSSPCWGRQSLTTARYFVSCSASVSVGWSALGLFLWPPVNWTAEPPASLSALHSAGWSAWRFLSWTAFVSEGLSARCSVSCCAWCSAWGSQSGPWAGPGWAACGCGSGSGSGADSGLRACFQMRTEAGMSLRGRRVS